MPTNEARNFDLSIEKTLEGGVLVLCRDGPGDGSIRRLPTQRFASDDLDLPPALPQVLYNVLVQTARHVLESALLHRQTK
jgi:hypothetical protein